MCFPMDTVGCDRQSQCGSLQAVKCRVGPAVVMEFLYAALHIRQAQGLVFCAGVRRQAALALSQAHCSACGVKPDPNLAAPRTGMLTSWEQSTQKPNLLVQIPEELETCGHPLIAQSVKHNDVSALGCTAYRAALMESSSVTSFG